uniref:IF rod domain-containing protein n=1 Tax=Myotis lucifugus TaxID=59463 RepID=G1QCI3_MYOLU
INITQLQLAIESKAFKEDLLFMKKHKEEVNVLPNQIADSVLTGKLDAPKSQDLSKIMADIWAQYDELTLRKARQLLVTEESTTVVTSQTAEIEAPEMTLTGLRYTVQSLEIKLDSMKNLKASLENSLWEVEMCYAMQMEQLNGILLQLESELAQTWAEGKCQAQEYKALLNIKVKLEAEITTYHYLLEEGEDFHLGDALDNSNSMQSIQKTTST